MTVKPKKDIDIIRSDIFEMDAFSGIFIIVHDPTILPYMLNMDSHRLFQGKVTVMPFVKQIQKLQPPPYKTACFQYQTKHRMFSNLSPREFRTKGECILRCLWDTLNKNDCVQYYSIYTKEIIEYEESKIPAQKVIQMLQADSPLLNMTIDGENSGFIKICPKTNKSYHEYIQARQHCTKTCPSACKVSTFYEDGMYYVPADDNYGGYATISWAPQPVAQIEHRPKWDLADFLGTIGGTVHIWLKLSVLSLILYLIKLIRTGEIFADTRMESIARWWSNSFNKK